MTVIKRLIRCAAVCLFVLGCTSACQQQVLHNLSDSDIEEMQAISVRMVNAYLRQKNPKIPLADRRIYEDTLPELISVQYDKHATAVNGSTGERGGIAVMGWPKARVYCIQVEFFGDLKKKNRQSLVVKYGAGLGTMTEEEWAAKNR